MQTQQKILLLKVERGKMMLQEIREARESE